MVSFQDKRGETWWNGFLEINTTGEAEINCSKEVVHPLIYIQPKNTPTCIPIGEDATS